MNEKEEFEKVLAEARERAPRVHEIIFVDGKFYKLTSHYGDPRKAAAEAVESEALKVARKIAKR